MKALVAAVLVVFVFAAAVHAEEPEPRWYAIVLVGGSVKPGTGPEFKTSFYATIERARARGLTLSRVRFKINELSQKPRHKTGRPTVATFDIITGSCTISVPARAQAIYQLHTELLGLRQNANFLRGQISVRFRTMPRAPEVPRAGSR